MAPPVRQVAVWLVAVATAVTITWVGLGLVTERVSAPPAAIELAGITAEPAPADGPAPALEATSDPTPSADDGAAASASPSPSGSPSTDDDGDRGGPSSDEPTSDPDDDPSGEPSDDDRSEDDDPDDGPSDDASDDPDGGPSDDESDDPDVDPTDDESDDPSDEPSDDEEEATGLDETRTVEATGGTARFRFVDDRVEVVYTTPAQGFAVEVERDGLDDVRVTFTSDDHESRVDADIEGGEPRVRVREEPDD